MEPTDGCWTTVSVGSGAEGASEAGVESGADDRGGEETALDDEDEAMLDKAELDKAELDEGTSVELMARGVEIASRGGFDVGSTSLVLTSGFDEDARAEESDVPRKSDSMKELKSV